MHVKHIQKNRRTLELRAQITRQIREFFWSQHFLEVETPHIVPSPGQDPYIQPMEVGFGENKKHRYSGYLHTSPEYSMKKMLAAGMTNIFSLGKVFRNEEPFNSQHNPEFTMLEWYRTDVDFYAIMNDVEKLVTHLSKPFETHHGFVRTSMKDLWKKHSHVDLDAYLTQKKMYELCIEKGHVVQKDEPYENLFYRIFVTDIEPMLKGKNSIVHHYPAPMAALAKLSQKNPGYAERFEVYLDGVELANAFTELTDDEEQLARLQKEQAQRKKNGSLVYDIDTEFTNAVKHMPECSGIALGVDRLMMSLLGCQNIEDVLPLPSSILFKKGI